jgi:protoporphyrinogen oxidase
MILEKNVNKRVVIIGAGPAGLTSAYQLCKAGTAAVVLEKDKSLGGLSRTVEYKGYRFDIGGHRFFTKVKAVDDLWREVMPNGDFLRRQRLSRIYYNKKYFHYPLRVSSTLFKLGLTNTCLILGSYLKARWRPEKAEQTFEQWVSNRFGRRLYRIFFKTYTEKVWGIPCHEISAEWATQRIRGLSLSTAIRNAVLKTGRGDGNVIKSLISEFDYPALGPGMMWERMAGLVQRMGGTIEVDAGVDKIRWRGGEVESVVIKSDKGERSIAGTHFISSMPIRELLQNLDPAPPSKVLAAAEKLNYRDFISVVLIVNKKNVFPDNWLYVHDPEVKLGRVQNFKNWSSQMVPNQSMTSLGLEYFCFEGDGLWTSSDEELINLAKREIEKIGLIKASEVHDAVVTRVPKAYPVYDVTYKEALAVVRGFLDGLTNLQLVGRNGMHKYNNQDHSMMTAMLAVENILGASHDLWEVNVDQEYHEENLHTDERGPGDLLRLNSTQPRNPQRLDRSLPRGLQPEISAIHE